MDNAKIREMLTAFLTEVANKARADALTGKSDIGSIFKTDGSQLQSLDPKMVESAILDINRATATKEGARRLVNGIISAAKLVASLYPA